MTSRRLFLSSACAAAAASADDATAELAGSIRARRKRGWQALDWKPARALPAGARLLGPREELGVWRLRHDAISLDIWQPLPRTRITLEQVRPEGNSGRAGYTLLDLAGTYLATGDDFYAGQSQAVMRRACEYKHWGGVNGKVKDVDLHAAALLMGLGVAYELFGADLPAAHRQFVVDKLALQGRRMYAHHVERATLPWEQNHTYIDLGGLWCTAVAVQGAISDAKQWQELGSRAIRNAVHLLDGGDGAFYEGVAYWNFGFAYHLLPLLELFRNATGEDPFASMASLSKQKYYLMHTLLPGGQYWLNLGDVGATHVARANLERARYTMFKFAAEYQDPECQFLAGYFGRVRKLGPADDPWTLLFWDPGVGESDPRENWSPAHHFDDLGLITARGSWRDDATHFAMRCGPSIGHHATAELLGKKVAKWNPGTGHVHPDLNGLLVFDHGEHFLVDTGYTWTKRTNEHSTVIVDGGGQVGDGERWPRYAPYERYGRIAAFVDLPGECCYVRGDAAKGYRPELRLNRFERHCSLMFGSDVTYAVIHDVLDSAVAHRYEWLLVAIATATKAGRNAYRVVSGHRAMTVHLIEPAACSFSQEIVKVHEREMEGSKPERGHRLSFSVADSARAEVLAVLTFHEADEEGPRVTHRRGSISVAYKGWSDTYTAGGPQGHHSIVRTEGDAVTRWAVQDATRFSLDGRELLEASAPVSVAASRDYVVVDLKKAVDVKVLAPGRLRVRLQPGAYRLRYS
jgi:hypothetical protein